MLTLLPTAHVLINNKAEEIPVRGLTQSGLPLAPQPAPCAFPSRPPLIRDHVSGDAPVMLASPLSPLGEWPPVDAGEDFFFWWG
jgi:hypothetical protein